MSKLWKERVAEYDQEVCRIGFAIEETAEAMARHLDADHDPGPYQTRLGVLLMDLGRLAEQIEQNVGSFAEGGDRANRLTTLALRYIRYLQADQFGIAYSMALMFVALAIAPYTK